MGRLSRAPVEIEAAAIDFAGRDFEINQRG